MTNPELETEFNSRFDDHHERWAGSQVETRLESLIAQQDMEDDAEIWMNTPEGKAWMAQEAVAVATPRDEDDEDDIPF